VVQMIRHQWMEYVKNVIFHVQLVQSKAITVSIVYLIMFGTIELVLSTALISTSSLMNMSNAYLKGLCVHLVSL